jgi:hypothetical protein
MIGEILSKMGPNETLPIAIVLVSLFFSALVAMTAIISTQWRWMRDAQIAFRLKESMIERDYSVEEIELVLGAGLARDDRSGRRARRALRSDHELSRRLVKAGSVEPEL